MTPNKRLMPRILAIVGVALCLSARVTGAPSDEETIFVHSIEVSQAFQNDTNSIHLVSDRSTAVRVRVGGSAEGVTGVLRVFVDGTQITPDEGVAPINPGLRPPPSNMWDRDYEEHTLNFELAAPTGIPPTDDADFVVELSTSKAWAIGSAEDLRVLKRISPRLYFTRIDYTPAGGGLPAIDDVRVGVGDAFVAGIYPVNDGDHNLYREGRFPTLRWNQDPNSNGEIDSNGEHSDILDWLESCRQLIVDEEGNGDMIFLYGWVNGNPIPSNGWGRVGGRVAFGNTEHSRYQRTYAHELGHNFGLSHNMRTLAPDAGWDTGARLERYPLTNNTYGRLKTSVSNDIMVAGRLTNEAWVDGMTYSYFLDHIVFDPEWRAGSDTRYQPRVAAVSGVFTTDGRELVRLNPVFRYDWLSEASINAPDGQYTVLIETDEANTFEATFNGILGDDDGESEEDNFGFFGVRLAVPADEEIASVRLVHRETETEMGELMRSERPQIEIVSPQSGDHLTGRVTVQFRVEDDTPLDEIRVQLAYSSDGGVQWVPVAVNVPAWHESAVFDAEQVLSADGSGVVRAIASDGLNTVSDEVVELTVGGQR